MNDDQRLRLLNPRQADAADSSKICEECGRQITKGPSGIDYGHRDDNTRREKGRCSHRPDCVDPNSVRAKHPAMTGGGAQR